MVTAELRDVNHFTGKVPGMQQPIVAWSQLNLEMSIISQGGPRNATANQIRAYTANSSMVTAELRDVNHFTGKVPRNATANQIRAFTTNSSMVTAELRGVNHFTGKVPRNATANQIRAYTANSSMVTELN